MTCREAKFANYLKSFWNQGLPVFLPAPRSLPLVFQLQCRSGGGGYLNLDGTISCSPKQFVNPTLIILMSPPLDVLRKFASSLLHPIPDWLPITSLKGKTCLWMGKTPSAQMWKLRAPNQSYTPPLRHHCDNIKVEGCKQPGCYRGLGAADSPPAPHPTCPLLSKTTIVA